MCVCGGGGGGEKHHTFGTVSALGDCREGAVSSEEPRQLCLLPLQRFREQKVQNFFEFVVVEVCEGHEVKRKLGKFDLSRQCQKSFFSSRYGKIS